MLNRVVSCVRPLCVPALCLGLALMLGGVASAAGDAITLMEGVADVDVAGLAGNLWTPIKAGLLAAIGLGASIFAVMFIWRTFRRAAR